MLSLLAAAASGHAPILGEDLSLRPGIDLGFFTLRYYSLAYHRRDCARLLASSPK